MVSRHNASPILLDQGFPNDLYQICSKRMKAALPRWLKNYDKCSEDVKKELMSMGTSTIDRYLRPYRAQMKRRNNTGTRPWKFKI